MNTPKRMRAVLVNGETKRDKRYRRQMEKKDKAKKFGTGR